MSGQGPALSNRLAVLAHEAAGALGRYRASRKEARRAFLECGAVLVEARALAKRGEWQPFLERSGIEARTALNMLTLARGAWTAPDVEAVGGLRAALDVASWAARLDDGAAVAGCPDGAAAALAEGPAAFLSWCDGRGASPADVVRTFAIPDEGEIPESNSGFPDRNDGEGRWHPARPSSNDWHTPRAIVEPARLALEGFDLDPASCEAANDTVRAARFFTAHDDGLAQRWAGRVWLNPPYSDRERPLSLWVGKLLDAHGAGDVPEACLLIPAAVETAYSQRCLCACAAVCLPSQRVEFLRPGEPGGHPPIGSAIYYFGARPHRFGAAYRRVGVVMRPWTATGGR